MSEISLTGDQMLTVLETVAKQGPLSAAEVARRCDINRTVAHRLLVTLALRGYVRRVSTRYTLGPTVPTLCERRPADIATLARQGMAQLAESCGETVVLHGISEAEAIVIEQAIGERHLVRVQHKPGSRHRLDRGASGWAILAFQGEKQRARLLEILGAGEEAELRIQKVRKQGFAVSKDELQLGVHGIAAPLLYPDGRCEASLGILVPSSRSDLIGSLAEELMATATAISKSLS